MAGFLGPAHTLPTEALQKEMASDMLESFGEGITNNDTSYIDLLTLLKTPQERLDIIKRNSHLYRHVIDASDEKLASFGLTREQIENRD